MKGLLFAASLWDEEPVPGFGPLSPVFKERLIILGALAVVLLLVFAWALAFRHRRRRTARREERRRRRHSFRQNATRSVAELREYVKQRRRRRRAHRPRNPTLAETGGLPPIRGGNEAGQPPPPP